MVTLNDATQTELKYLRSKWDAERIELLEEHSTKQGRLNKRLDTQTEDAVKQAEREAAAAHAQTVLTSLIANGESQAVIDEQQSVVNQLVELASERGLSSTYVSTADALQLEADLAALTFAANYRETKIAEIDLLIV